MLSRRPHSSQNRLEWGSRPRFFKAESISFGVLLSLIWPRLAMGAPQPKDKVHLNGRLIWPGHSRAFGRPAVTEATNPVKRLVSRK